MDEHIKFLIYRWAATFYKQPKQTIADYRQFVAESDEARRKYEATLGDPETADAHTSCEWCCDDEQWPDDPWTQWQRWFYCGPLGLGCPCVSDPPEA